jgi:hypothetical protein
VRPDGAASSATVTCSTLTAGCPLIWVIDVVGANSGQVARAAGDDGLDQQPAGKAELLGDRGRHGAHL